MRAVHFMKTYSGQVNKLLHLSQELEQTIDYSYLQAVHQDILCMATVFVITSGHRTIPVKNALCLAVCLIVQTICPDNIKGMKQ